MRVKRQRPRGLQAPPPPPRVRARLLIPALRDR